MIPLNRCIGRLLILGACASLFAARAASAQVSAEKPGGTITGRVEHSSAKKIQTIVYLVEVPGDFKAPEKAVAIKQAGKAFAPGVLTVLAGTTVSFTNEDSFTHNVFSPDFPSVQKGKGGTNYYDLGTWGQGETRSFTFKQPGVYTQLCSIHPEMVGYVVVLQNPYFAIVDKDGKFRISDVPAGSYRLKIWNERLRPKQLEKAYDAKVAQGGETEVVVEP